MHYLRYPEVLKRANVKSKTTIDKMESSGDFPRRVQIAPNAVAWPSDEIDIWDIDRRAARFGETFRAGAKPVLRDLAIERAGAFFGEVSAIIGSKDVTDADEALAIATEAIRQIAQPERAAA